MAYPEAKINNLVMPICQVLFQNNVYYIYEEYSALCIFQDSSTYCFKKTRFLSEILHLFNQFVYIYIYMLLYMLMAWQVLKHCIINQIQIILYMYSRLYFICFQYLLSCLVPMFLAYLLHLLIQL